jgi:hypothetical protein
MKQLFLILATIAFVGCKDTEMLTTDILKEKAIVVTLIHSPSEHNTELTQTAIHNGDLMGTDFNGNQGIKVGNNLQVTTTTIPEKFGVAFQCEHGTFTVEGDRLKDKVLYEKLYREVGDTVIILYKENYTLTYETKDKERKLISKVLTSLDFIDAQKISD